MARWTIPHRTDHLGRSRPPCALPCRVWRGRCRLRAPAGKALCLLTREHRKDVGESNFINLFSVILVNAKLSCVVTVKLYVCLAGKAIILFVYFWKTLITSLSW